MMRSKINVSQAADYIGCTPRQVYRLVKRGSIEAYRVGDRRGLRIYVDSIDSFIESKNFDY